LKIARYLVIGEVTCCSAAKNSQVATLDKRQTRFVALVKVAGKDSETVISALIDNAHNLPASRSEKVRHAFYETWSDSS